MNLKYQVFSKLIEIKLNNTNKIFMEFIILMKIIYLNNHYLVNNYNIKK